LEVAACHFWNGSGQSLRVNSPGRRIHRNRLSFGLSAETLEIRALLSALIPFGSDVFIDYENTGEASRNTLRIDAGIDQAIALDRVAFLDGMIVLGESAPSIVGAQLGWTKVSGPGEVFFDDPFSAATSVSFNTAGAYVLRLSLAFENYSAFDDVRMLVTQPVSYHQGIWISREKLMSLPTFGAAWDILYSAARSTTGTPNIQDQNNNADVRTLAKALVGVRLNDQQLMAEARANILAAMGTESGGRTLALGRNLASYVIAADIVKLSEEDDQLFRSWLRQLLTETFDGRTLISTHEDRPNNWGTMAGGSRAAIAAYLGDQQELARVAQVFKGWLGDRSSYAGFSYGSDLSWQADPSSPVGINPVGATKYGHRIDGALPEEMRRGGSFQWPPAETGYPWEALQGAFVQAEILHRAGFAVYAWEQQALYRAAAFLFDMGWGAEGDDEWLPWLIDARYGTAYAVNPSASAGKIMGWTAWTHQGESAG
jgi:hypothetical protein